jgi:hypothetical protein
MCVLMFPVFNYVGCTARAFLNMHLMNPVSPVLSSSLFENAFAPQARNIFLVK